MLSLYTTTSQLIYRLLLPDKGTVLTPIDRTVYKGYAEADIKLISISFAFYFLPADKLIMELQIINQNATPWQTLHGHRIALNCITNDKPSNIDLIPATLSTIAYQTPIQFNTCNFIPSIITTDHHQSVL